MVFDDKTLPSVRCRASTRVGLTGILLLGLSFASPGTATAQVSSNGPQFQVNTFTTHNQAAPAVAVAPGGRFVVAWQSYGSGGTDHDGNSIQAQRFGAFGTRLGGEFQINSFTSGFQESPNVSWNPLGGFVVVWESDGSPGTDSDYTSVQARRYDLDGNALGDQFQVNTETTGRQYRPAVAVGPGGDFVVVWTSNEPLTAYSDYFGIRGQRYDSAGAPVGGEFNVNSYTTNEQNEPAIDLDGQSRFVVVWQSRGSAGSDNHDYSIQARRFDSDGVPVGSDFQVNVVTQNRQSHPEVAVDPDGRFVVAWQSQGSLGDDTSLFSIQMQRFNSLGTPLGSQTQVNAYTTDEQRNARVARDGSGNFLLSWDSYGSFGDDSEDWSVQLRRLDEEGVPQNPELQVNSYTTSTQTFPALGIDAEGGLVVAWQSAGSDGTDDSIFGIQARRFESAFFYDGFESGDTGRWSAVMP